MRWRTCVRKALRINLQKIRKKQKYFLTNETLFNIISNVPFRQVVVWGLSSAGRASALQAEGHRFEPYRPHSNGHKTSYGGIAQLARAHGSYPWCRGFKSPFRYYRKRESERIPFFVIVMKEKLNTRHHGGVEGRWRSGGPPFSADRSEAKTKFPFRVSLVLGRP